MIPLRKNICELSSIFTYSLQKKKGLNIIQRENFI